MFFLTVDCMAVYDSKSPSLTLKHVKKYITALELWSGQ
jgi:hypothetical protein